MILRLLVVLAISLSACSTRGLEFTEETRVQWVTEDRSTVSLPLTLEWEAPGYELTGPDGSSDPNAGYFAVFVDRSPQSRGALLDEIAEDSESCSADPGCPTLEWYRNRQVHIVEQGTSVTIDQLPFDSSDDGPELHDFVLVLLDGEGRRQGESALRIRLIVERDA